MEMRRIGGAAHFLRKVFNTAP